MKIEHKLLRQAAKALERAADAAYIGQIDYVFPCAINLAASRAEIDCAIALIEKAQIGDDPK